MDSKPSYSKPQDPVRRKILQNWCYPESKIRGRSPKPYSNLTNITLHGTTYNRADFVELLPQDNEQFILAGDILYVRQIRILQNSRLGVVISGLLFRKSCYFPTDSQNSNEMTLMLKFLLLDRESVIEADVSSTLLGRKRQFQFVTEVPPDPTVFFCQSSFNSYYHTISEPRSTGKIEREFRKFSAVAHTMYATPPPNQVNMMPLSEKYTYVSGFSGGGGEIEGAKAAGATVVFAFDKNTKSCETLKTNNPGLKVVKSDQFDILNDDGFKSGLEEVDMLHLSLPCQYFSPAHRVKGALDDENSATLFCTAAQLRYWNPKVHTQEQTAGLLERHPEYFFRLISDIFTAGYNVRWKVFQFRNFELSGQQRRRLIIMASRHDIPLPSFPEMVSGGANPELVPNISLRALLSDIPPNASFHHPTLTTISEQGAFRYDPDEHVLGCITTNGTLQRHWTGRNFTIRELATIQGFSVTHHFCGNEDDVKRQIGNAVPPVVWKHFVKQVITALEKWRMNPRNGINQDQDIGKLLALDNSEITVNERDLSKRYQDDDLDLWITEEYLLESDHS